MPDDNKPSRSKLGIAITSVLAAGTLIAGSLVGQNTNANSLEPAAQAALQQAGISGVTVTMQGREAYLSGPGLSQDQLTAAKTAVEGVHGVRWARVQLDNPGTAGTPETASASSQAASPAASPAPTTPSPQVTSPSPAASQAASTPAPEVTSPSPESSQAASTPSPEVTSPSPSPSSPSQTSPSAGPLTDAEKAQVNAVVVNFASGSTSLDAQAKAKLDAIVPLLAKSDVKVVVKGYVSLPNQAASVQPYSQARAQAVVDYLVSKGIDAGRVTAQAMGSSDPVADNDTDDHRYQNQRATLTVA